MLFRDVVGPSSCSDGVVSLPSSLSRSSVVYPSFSGPNYSDLGGPSDKL